MKSARTLPRTGPIQSIPIQSNAMQADSPRSNPIKSNPNHSNPIQSIFPQGGQGRGKGKRGSLVGAAHLSNDNAGTSNENTNLMWTKSLLDFSFQHEYMAYRYFRSARCFLPDTLGLPSCANAFRDQGRPYRKVMKK